MEIAEKREKIASCIVDLKKGLKKIRREDIDGAIQLLLLYDQDLKRIAKLPAKPIESQANIKYETDYLAVNTGRSVDVDTLVEKPITVAIINGDNGSWAYPLHGTLENTVAGITGGHILPLAKVQIDPWMKEHRSDEIAFITVYATVVSGRIIVKNENILTVGCMAHMKGHADAYSVRKIEGDKVWLDNGFFKSLIPHKISNIVPVKQTEVKYFIIEKWEQR